MFGEGELDLVFVSGYASHLDLEWENPAIARFFRGLASFGRLIRFDKRGLGLSDRNVAPAPLEERMDDVRAVMDAVGSERAVLMGISKGAPMSMLFAATYPERTDALVLYGGMARATQAPDYPWGPTLEGFLEATEELIMLTSTRRRHRRVGTVAPGGSGRDGMVGPLPPCCDEP